MPKRSPTDSATIRANAAKARQAARGSKKNEERWAIARGRFESDPQETFAALARDLGCSRQSVQEKAKKDGWVKAKNNAEISAAAHIAADRVPAEPLKAPDMPEREDWPVGPKGNPKRLEIPKGPLPDLTPVATALAIDDRAKVLSRHRNEALALRGWAQEIVAKRMQPGAGEQSKIFVRTVLGMARIQEMERKSWGLDMPDPTVPTLGNGAVLVRVVREGAAPDHTLDEDDEEIT